MGVDALLGVVDEHVEKAGIEPPTCSTEIVFQ
jgi:hypothetical protein